jgi:hypothetical protein
LDWAAAGITNASVLTNSIDVRKAEVLQPLRDLREVRFIRIILGMLGVRRLEIAALGMGRHSITQRRAVVAAWRTYTAALAVSM